MFPVGVGRGFTSNRKGELMPHFDVVIRDSATDAEVAELRDAIHEFNYDATGYRDGLSLSCFLRDDDRALVAGIDGFTWGGYARVEYLWVTEALRGQGLGSRLLAAAEEEARRRGCGTIVLDTHSFQAPDLYRARGYTERGTTLATPRGYSQTLFQKNL
jgi:GNAT superfamily N-acetyltransferase